MDNFSYRVFLTIAEYMCILPKDTHIESESEIRLDIVTEDIN